MEPILLSFSGTLPEGFPRALEELGPLLGLVAGEGGVPVEVFRSKGPEAEKQGGRVRLGWSKPVHLYRALSLRSGSILSPNMLKAVEASQKPLEKIFCTMHLQRRTENVEEELRVKDALTARPSPKATPAKGGKSTLDNIFRRQHTKNQERG